MRPARFVAPVRYLAMRIVSLTKAPFMSSMLDVSRYPVTTASPTRNGATSARAMARTVTVSGWPVQRTPALPTPCAMPLPDRCVTVRERPQ